jgi:hypothetical protein
MNELKIRPAKPSDLAFILKGNEVIDSLSGIKPKRGLTPEYIKQDVFSENPKAWIEIVEARNEMTSQIEPAAFIIYSFFYMASEGSGIWVSKFYIDPFCRKMSLGPKIREYLFERYPDCPSIFGCVGIENKIARVFFSSMGATRYDDLPLYGVKRK